MRGLTNPEISEISGGAMNVDDAFFSGAMTFGFVVLLRTGNPLDAAYASLLGGTLAVTWSATHHATHRIEKFIEKFKTTAEKPAEPLVMEPSHT